jgi:hypothetical protein
MDESTPPPPFKVGGGDTLKRQETAGYNAAEETAVKLILAAYGASAHEATIRSESKRGGGTGGLSLAWLPQAVPAFPLRLVLCRLRYVHEISAADIFNDFKRLVIFNAWVDAFATIGDPTAHVGILFHWPTVKRGGRFMVFHNMPRFDGDAKAANDQVRLAVAIRRPNGRLTRFTVERLGDLLADLAPEGSSNA